MAPLKLAPLLLVAVAACARFEANETIELVPSSTWTPTEVETLRSAARCWNLQFGLAFDVVNQPSTAQVVNVEFNDFTCWSSAGRFTPAEPAQIAICPISKWAEPEPLPLQLRLFAALDHELGHAAGIRHEAENPNAVMGKGGYISILPNTYGPATAFTDEDVQMLNAEAEHLPENPICAGKVILVEDPDVGAACGCVLDTSKLESVMLAYDEERRQTVMFGGLGTAADQTRIWDGASWTTVTPAISPPGRSGGEMVYDAGRKRIVLFGGNGATGYRSDTWEWDGTTWTDVTPAQSPPARAAHALAYDAARHVVVMFGGVITRPYGFADDTWIFDGTTWVEQVGTNGTKPPQRDSAAMTYDPVRHTVMLFGGYDRSYYSDQWEWDGANWSRVMPPSTPGARGSFAMVSDPTRARIMMFGGQPSASSSFDDLWQWDGATWNKIPPSLGPSGRSGHKMALDTSRDRLVLVGGYAHSDTWEWDGTRWVNFSYQRCGDEILEVGETCDDGNLAPNDGCSSTCQLE